MSVRLQTERADRCETFGPQLKPKKASWFEFTARHTHYSKRERSSIFVGIDTNTFGVCTLLIGQILRVALHFYDVTLTAKMPQNKAYPKTLKTLGDHLRKRRLDLKLFQKDVARAIGVDTLTVCNWENNLTTPRLYLLPKICHFLGSNPLQVNPTTLGEKIKQYRIQKGLSLRKLAKELDIDPGTLARWEKYMREPKGKLRVRLDPFLVNMTG